MGAAPHDPPHAYHRIAGRAPRRVGFPRVCCEPALVGAMAPLAESGRPPASKYATAAARRLAHIRRGRAQAPLLHQDAARSRRRWRCPLRHHRQGHEAPAHQVRPRRSRRIHHQPDSKGRCLSPYKPKDGRSPYFHYDFQVRGHRFHGSTKCTSRREAEKVEAAEREKAKRLVAQLAAVKTSLKLDDVAERYWQEVGQHHAGADNTDHDLALLIKFFGEDKLLTDITGDDVARIVAWRRGHRRQDGALISPHTVNHTTKQLRTLFARAKLCGVRFEQEPK